MRIWVVGVLLFLLGGLAFPQDNSMLDFGTQILASAPDAVRNGTPLVKARYACAIYCDMLGNRVTNNQNLFTRLGYLFRTGDVSRWTCADHANNLDFVLRGMGVEDTFLVRADSRSGLPTPNADHGALGLVSDGDVFLFDPWQQAVQTGSFVGGGTSEWNGMGSGLWEARMRQQGFRWFSVESDKYHSSMQDIVSDKLYRAQSRMRPTLRITQFFITGGPKNYDATVQFATEGNGWGESPNLTLKGKLEGPNTNRDFERTVVTRPGYQGYTFPINMEGHPAGSYQVTVALHGLNLNDQSSAPLTVAAPTPSIRISQLTVEPSVIPPGGSAKVQAKYNLSGFGSDPVITPKVTLFMEGSSGSGLGRQEVIQEQCRQGEGRVAWATLSVNPDARPGPVRVQAVVSLAGQEVASEVAAQIKASEVVPGSLTLVQVIPWTTWSNGWRGSEGSIVRDLGEGSTLQAQWASPPQILPPQGFRVSQQLQVNASQNQRNYVQGVILGHGAEVDPRDQSFTQLCAESGQSRSRTNSVTVVPHPGATEVRIEVGVAYGPFYTYVYRLSR